MKTCLDSNVISVYAALPPKDTYQNEQWCAVRLLFTTAKAQQIRLVSSSFLRDECERGDAGASARRMVAARKITIFSETPAMRRIAKKIVLLFNKGEGDHLQNDARHYAAALESGAKYLVTTNVKHFKALKTKYEGDIKIYTPAEMLRKIVDVSPARNPARHYRSVFSQLDRKTPFIRRIEKSVKKAGLLACLMDGFTQEIAEARRKLRAKNARR